MTFWQIMVLLAVMGWCVNLGVHFGDPDAQRHWAWKVGVNVALVGVGFAALVTWP